MKVGYDPKVNTKALENSGPSLLRLIMDEVDELNNKEKEALLWKIKLDKALELSKKVDETFKDKFLPLTDDQIVNLVSANRKADYDAKIHH